MVEYLIKRLFLMVATLFGIIVLTFGITRLAPGDPTSSTAGGEGKVNDAAIMEGILAQRRIYGLDKPIFFNARFEERSWFARDALERASQAQTSSAAQVEIKIAKRELLDQATALYPDLIPMLPELERRGNLAASLKKQADDTAKLYEGLVEKGELTEKESLQAQRDVLRAAKKTLGFKTGSSGADLKEELAEVAQGAQALPVALETLEKSARHDLPKDYDKRSAAEKMAYWQGYWKEFAPKDGDIDAHASETVAKALDSTEGALAEEIAKLGPLASPALLERLREANTQERASRALSYLAEAQRKPGWRPDPRMIGDYLRDSCLPKALDKRQELYQKFVTALPEETTQAIASADPAIRQEALKPLDTFWHLPVLAGLYFWADHYEAKRDIFGAIESVLASDASQELKRSGQLRGWPEAKGLIAGLLDIKRGQVDKWWRQARFRFLDFGTGSHLWNTLANTQFGAWMGKIARLDFDESYKYNRPVLEIIIERLPITLTLSFLSIFLAYIVAIPLGIKSAVDYQSFSDKVLTLVLFVLYSLPSFWVGEMLIIYFCSQEFFDWFPSYGLHSKDVSSYPWISAKLHSAGFSWVALQWDYAWHLFLPVVCLTYGSFASLSRYMRSSMLETIRQDFIRTARAKGLSERVVVYKHALRNSLIPILTLAATMLPALISGSVIIETVFTIEGMGKLAVDAVFARDYPLINAIAIFSAALTLLGILLSDLSYALVDPRITYQ